MRALWVVTLAAMAGCHSVDPDNRRFSCALDVDCGSGWDCIRQTSDAGRCFKKGQCVAENCNGKDDDCDGEIDEGFNQACSDAGVGACAQGQQKCVLGSLVCAPNFTPVAELCNGADDDCNGLIDDTFDLTGDNLNCGSCGARCAAGTTCRLGVCRESSCSDGIDNDADGGVDCLDPACLSAFCFAASDAGFVCGLLLIPDAGGLDGGADGGIDGGADAGMDAGVDGGSDGGPRSGCFPPEGCVDGIDNDQDGLTDCEDPDCDAQLCVSGTSCTNRVCPGPG